jgi:hypothetical protein
MGGIQAGLGIEQSLGRSLSEGEPVRASRRSSRIGAVAALVLVLATLWQGPPAGAQTFPDAHICELSVNPPFNSRPGVISVSPVVQCFTDRNSRPRTPGQFESIRITIKLFQENGLPVGLPKEVSSNAPSTGLTGSLTYPDPRSTDPQVCLSGRHFAEVTGTVVFKSGEPKVVNFRSNLDGSEILRTGAAFVTCESSFPPPPSPIPTPPPAPNPTPAPEPEPAPEPPPPCEFGLTCLEP